MLTLFNFVLSQACVIFPCAWLTLIPRPVKMSCVHYKFSSKRDYNTVTFDGLHITLSELKKQIMGRERLKATDCDLQITNAQTQEGEWSADWRRGADMSSEIKGLMGSLWQIFTCLCRFGAPKKNNSLQKISWYLIDWKSWKVIFNFVGTNFQILKGCAILFDMISTVTFKKIQVSVLSRFSTYRCPTMWYLWNATSPWYSCRSHIKLYHRK